MRRFLLFSALALLVALIASAAFFAHAWTRKGPIEPSGGLYFAHRVELPAPLFRRSDERWRLEPLASTQGTLGQEGCAVSAAAMVLGSYGIDTDPSRLNQFLNGNGGYTPQGRIYWE